MTIQLAVQQRQEFANAQINRILRCSEDNSPQEVLFVIQDKDGSYVRGRFYIPEGFDTSILHQGSAEIWKLTIAARTNYFGDVALCIVGIEIMGQVISERYLRTETV